MSASGSILMAIDMRFGFATLERWYYLARDAQDPVAANGFGDQCARDGEFLHPLSFGHVLILGRWLERDNIHIIEPSKRLFNRGPDVWPVQSPVAAAQRWNSD